MRYRPDIDGLRAIAVLPVCFFHAGLGAPGGFIGVDVFFVISGFLITSILLEDIRTKNFSILTFYERRARRLFPALFVVLAATTVGSAFVMTPFDLVDYAGSLAATALFLANVWFFRQTGYFTEDAELQPLLHTWSLGVEEQFYVLFPLILWTTLRYFTFRQAIAVMLVLIVASFGGTIAAMPNVPEAAFFLAQLRAWELLIGALLAFVVLDERLRQVSLPRWAAEPIAIVGLIAILFPVFAYDAETPFPGWAALPPCLGTAILIWTSRDDRTAARRFLSLRPMVFIGGLSYSLYLWHWPLIALTYYALGPLTPGLGAACLVAAFFLSLLSWRYIETPARDRARVGKRAVLMGSSVAVGLTLSVATLFSILDGLPNRMDPDFLALANSGNFLHDRRDCHRVTPERSASGDVCIRGAENVTPSFVLVGDSHADAISPAVFRVSEELGWAGYQYTDAGFLPLPDVWRTNQRDEDVDDAQAFVSFMESHPEIRIVLLTRFWLHQMTGYSYRHAGHIWADDAYDGSGTAYNRSATIQGLERLATLLSDRQIVLLDDVPTGRDLHIRNHLRRLTPPDFSDLGLPVSERDAQRAEYEPMLRELATRFSNVHYRRVYSALCDDSFCPLFSDATLLYRNGDHLSWEGALYLLDGVRQLFASLPEAQP